MFEKYIFKNKNIRKIRKIFIYFLIIIFNYQSIALSFGQTDTYSLSPNSLLEFIEKYSDKSTSADMNNNQRMLLSVLLDEFLQDERTREYLFANNSLPVFPPALRDNDQMLFNVRGEIFSRNDVIKVPAIINAMELDLYFFKTRENIEISEEYGIKNEEDVRIAKTRGYSLSRTNKSDLISESIAKVYGKCVGQIRIIPDAVRGYQTLFDLKEYMIPVVSYYPTEDPTLARPAGIITRQEPSGLSHAEIRARFWGVPHIVIPESYSLDELDGKWVFIDSSNRGVDFRLASAEEKDAWESYKPKPPVPELLRPNLETTAPILNWTKAHSPKEVSYKFANLHAISSGVYGSRLGIQWGSVIPFATYFKVLKSNRWIESKIHEIVTDIDNSDINDIRQKLAEVRDLIENMQIPDYIWGNATVEDGMNEWSIDYSVLNETWDGEGLFIRTGTNAEDLPDFPGFGAGQYATFTNIKRGKVREYIKKAWASVWNVGAYIERQKLGINHFSVVPAVQLTQAIDADYSFVIHTADPDDENTNVIIIEIVQGLGEGLVGDKYPGRAHRFVYNKEKDEIIDYQAATKKTKVVLNDAEGTEDAQIDYYNDIFLQEGLDSTLALQIARGALSIEKVIGRPQDIEGAISWNEYNKEYDVTLFQSRSQVGYDRYPTHFEEYFRAHKTWAYNLAKKYEKYKDNIIINKVMLLSAADFRKKLKDTTQNHYPEELHNLIRLFLNMGGEGELLLRLFFAAGVKGIHAYSVNALEQFDAQTLAGILNSVIVNRETIPVQELYHFEEYNEFFATRFLSHLCERSSRWNLDDVRSLLSALQPQAICALINEYPYSHYQHKDLRDSLKNAFESLSYEKQQTIYSDISGVAHSYFNFAMEPYSENVTCGTIDSTGHEGGYWALDTQLERQFESLKQILQISEKNKLTEEEADKALVEYVRRYGIEITAEQLQEYRRMIIHSVRNGRDHSLQAMLDSDRSVEIFFSIPETGTELFWVEDPETAEWMYAGGHFNNKGTRIHISLPVILNHGIQAGIDIAIHDLSHIQHREHREDSGMAIVREIAEVDRLFNSQFSDDHVLQELASHEWEQVPHVSQSVVYKSSGVFIKVPRPAKVIMGERERSVVYKNSVLRILNNLMNRYYYTVPLVRLIKDSIKRIIRFFIPQTLNDSREQYLKGYELLLGHAPHLMVQTRILNNVDIKEKLHLDSLEGNPDVLILQTGKDPVLIDVLVDRTQSGDWLGIERLIEKAFDVLDEYLRNGLGDIDSGVNIWNNFVVTGENEIKTIDAGAITDEIGSILHFCSACREQAQKTREFLRHKGITETIMLLQKSKLTAKPSYFVARLKELQQRLPAEDARRVADMFLKTLIQRFSPTNIVALWKQHTKDPAQSITSEVQSMELFFNSGRGFFKYTESGVREITESGKQFSVYEQFLVAQALVAAACDVYEEQSGIDLSDIILKVMKLDREDPQTSLDQLSLIVEELSGRLGSTIIFTNKLSELEIALLVESSARLGPMHETTMKKRVAERLASLLDEFQNKDFHLFAGAEYCKVTLFDKAESVSGVLDALPGGTVYSFGDSAVDVSFLGLEHGTVTNRGYFVGDESNLVDITERNFTITDKKKTEGTYAVLAEAIERHEQNQETISAIVADIDDTIAPLGETISDEMAKLCARALKSGIRLSFITGGHFDQGYYERVILPIEEAVRKLNARKLEQEQNRKALLPPLLRKIDGQVITDKEGKEFTIEVLPATGLRNEYVIRINAPYKIGEVDWEIKLGIAAHAGGGIALNYGKEYAGPNTAGIIYLRLKDYPAGPDIWLQAADMTPHKGKGLYHNFFNLFAQAAPEGTTIDMDVIHAETNGILHDGVPFDETILGRVFAQNGFSSRSLVLPSITPVNVMLRKESPAGALGFSRGIVDEDLLPFVRRNGTNFNVALLLGFPFSGDTYKKLKDIIAAFRKVFPPEVLKLSFPEQCHISIGTLSDLRDTPYTDDEIVLKRREAEEILRTYPVEKLPLRGKLELKPDGAIIFEIDDPAIVELVERLREPLKAKNYKVPGIVHITIGKPAKDGYTDEDRRQIQQIIKHIGHVELGTISTDTITFGHFTKNSDALHVETLKPTRNIPLPEGNIGDGSIYPVENDEIRSMLSSLSDLSNGEITYFIDYTTQFLELYSDYFMNNPQELLISLIDPSRLSIDLRMAPRKEEQTRAEYQRSIGEKFTKYHRDYINGMDPALLKKLYAAKLLQGKRGDILSTFLIDHMRNADELSEEQQRMLSLLEPSKSLLEQGVTIDSIIDYSSGRFIPGNVIYKIILSIDGVKIPLYLKGFVKNLRDKERKREYYEDAFYRLAKILGRNTVESSFYDETVDVSMDGFILMQEIKGVDSNTFFDVDGENKSFRIKPELSEYGIALIHELAQYGALSDLFNKGDRVVIRTDGAAQYPANYLIDIERLQRGVPSVTAIDHWPIFNMLNYSVLLDLRREGSPEMGILMAFDEKERERLLKEYEDAYLKQWEDIKHKADDIGRMVVSLFGEQSLEYRLYLQALERNPHEELEKQKRALRIFADRNKLPSSPAVMYDILSRFDNGERDVPIQEIIQERNIGEASIENYMRLLRDAGLVTRKNIKGEVCFRISPDIVASYEKRTVLQDILDEEFQKGMIKKKMANQSEKSRIVKRLIDEKENIRELMEDRSLLVNESMKGSNLACGTIGVEEHEGFTSALDEQLKRQYARMKKSLELDEERDLTEEEADKALVEYAERYGITVSLAELNEYRTTIREKHPGFRNVEIYFGVPETGTDLFWVQNPVSGEWAYAGGHFNQEGTRIHLSLPIIYFHGISAGIDVAMHDLNHVLGHGHLQDAGYILVTNMSHTDKPRIAPIAADEEDSDLFAFQEDEKTILKNNPDQNKAYRYIDEDHPIDMVIGNQLIRIMKSGKELVFVVYNLSKPEQPAAEFKIDSNRTINIGRFKESRGVVRDFNGDVVDNQQIMNDIDLPGSNTRASRRHISLTVDAIEDERTRITFQDLTSLNGSELYSFGSFIEHDVPIKTIYKDQEHKKKSLITDIKEEMNAYMKRLNFQIDLDQDQTAIELELKTSLFEKRDALTEQYREQIGQILEVMYTEELVQRWVENLVAFKDEITFLRDMKINFIIRRDGPITPEFEQLVAKQFRMLRRIPLGLLQKCNKYFPYVVSDKEVNMEANVLGYKRNVTQGTVMINNAGFAQSEYFSSASLSFSLGKSMVLPVSDMSEEHQIKREKMSLSPETTCAHELYHHLHLDEAVLPVDDFIDILNAAERRKWIHKSMFDGRTIMGLPDVVVLMEDALQKGEREALETMKMVCRDYSFMHSTFYSPAEVVSFCLSDDIAALKELGPQRFSKIRRIARRSMLRSKDPVDVREILDAGLMPIYEIYTFSNNKHRVRYGSQYGEIFFTENDVIRNDPHELDEEQRDQIRLDLAVKISRREIDTFDLYRYFGLLKRIVEDPELRDEKLFFLEDAAKVYDGSIDIEKLREVHAVINASIYEAGFQISFQERYELFRGLLGRPAEPDDGFNVACGTVCESGHEGSYEALDEQLKRQFELLGEILGTTENTEEKEDLTEIEADKALVEYAKRYGIEVTTDQLQDFRNEIIRHSTIFNQHLPMIFFSIPETGTDLFWIGTDYAAGHFNRKGTRIHISLPLILNQGIDIGTLIAQHELKHIEGKGHTQDQALKLVSKIAISEEPERTILLDGNKVVIRDLIEGDRRAIRILVQALDSTNISEIEKAASFIPYISDQKALLSVFRLIQSGVWTKNAADPNVARNYYILQQLPQIHADLDMLMKIVSRFAGYPIDHVRDSAMDVYQYLYGLKTIYDPLELLFGSRDIDKVNAKIAEYKISRSELVELLQAFSDRELSSPSINDFISKSGILPYPRNVRQSIWERLPEDIHKAFLNNLFRKLDKIKIFLSKEVRTLEENTVIEDLSSSERGKRILKKIQASSGPVSRTALRQEFFFSEIGSISQHLLGSFYHHYNLQWRADKPDVSVLDYIYASLQIPDEVKPEITEKSIENKLIEEFERGHIQKEHAGAAILRLCLELGIDPDSEESAVVSKLFYTYKFLELIEEVNDEIIERMSNEKSIKNLRRIQREELRNLNSNRMKKQHRALDARLRDHYESYRAVFEENKERIAARLGFEIDYDKDIRSVKDTTAIQEWLLGRIDELPEGYEFNVGKSRMYTILRNDELYLNLTGMNPGLYWITFEVDQEGNKYALIWENEDASLETQSEPVQKFVLEKSKRLLAQKQKGTSTGYKPEALITTSRSIRIKDFLTENGEVPPGFAAPVKGIGKNKGGALLRLCGFGDFAVQITTFLYQFIGETLWVTFEEDANGDKFAFLWKDRDASLNKKNPYGYLRKYYLMKDGTILNNVKDGRSTGKTPQIFTWKDHLKVILKGKEIRPEDLAHEETLTFLVSCLMHDDPSLRKNAQLALQDWLPEAGPVAIRKVRGFINPQPPNDAIQDLNERLVGILNVVPDGLPKGSPANMFRILTRDKNVSLNRLIEQTGLSADTIERDMRLLRKAQLVIRHRYDDSIEYSLDVALADKEEMISKVQKILDEEFVPGRITAATKEFEERIRIIARLYEATIEKTEISRISHEEILDRNRDRMGLPFVRRQDIALAVLDGKDLEGNMPTNIATVSIRNSDVPVVALAPHSGHVFDEMYKPYKSEDVTQKQLDGEVDVGTDLMADQFLNTVVANESRAVIDLNRTQVTALFESRPYWNVGKIWKTELPLQIRMEILQKQWELLTYLEIFLREMIARHGFVVVPVLHSYSGKHQEGKDVPTFNPVLLPTKDPFEKHVRDSIRKTLNAEIDKTNPDWTVAENYPFSSTAFLGQFLYSLSKKIQREEGLPYSPIVPYMVESNKSAYMDEDTFEIDVNELAKLTKVLKTALDAGAQEAALLKDMLLVQVGKTSPQMSEIAGEQVDMNLLQENTGRKPVDYTMLEAGFSVDASGRTAYIQSAVTDPEVIHEYLDSLRLLRVREGQDYSARAIYLPMKYADYTVLSYNGEIMLRPFAETPERTETIFLLLNAHTEGLIDVVGLSGLDDYKTLAEEWGVEEYLLFFTMAQSQDIVIASPQEDGLLDHINAHPVMRSYPEHILDKRAQDAIGSAA